MNRLEDIVGGINHNWPMIYKYKQRLPEKLLEGDVIYQYLRDGFVLQL